MARRPNILKEVVGSSWTVWKTIKIVDQTNTVNQFVELSIKLNELLN